MIVQTSLQWLHITKHLSRSLGVSTLVLFLLFIPSYVFSDTPASSLKLKTCVDFIPYLIDENGQRRWLGRHIHLLHIIAEEAGIQIAEPKRESFDNCLQLMKSGAVDIMPGLLFNEERAEYMEFVAYTGRAAVAVFSLKTNKDKISKDAELLIAYEKGYIVPSTIAEVYYNSQFIDVSDISAGIRLVEKQRVDAFIAPKVTAFEVMTELNMNKNKFVYSMFSQPNESVHVALSKASPKVTETTKRAISNAINRLKEKGLIQKILETKN